MTLLSIDLIRTDGGTQPRAAIYEDWINDYVNDMRSGAKFPPVVVFYDGTSYWLADGFHRTSATRASGGTEIEADIREGTQRDAVLYSVSANGEHGHRRTNEDKRRSIDVLLNDPEWSRWSDREIAAHIGVHNTTVGNRRRYSSSVDNLQIAPRLVTRDGVTYEMKTDTIGQRGRALGTMKSAYLYQGYGPEEDDDDSTSEEDTNGSTSDVAFNHRAQGTGENEWYTPPEYIASAREVLGEIDLDPASSDIANQTVRAERFFSLEDDGLAQAWKGRVWMNPPYAQPWIARFTEKLVAEYAAGNVSEAIALTHNYTDTAWFQHAARACDAICFTRGRIGFLSPTGERAAPTQGQAFFYFGDNIERFAEAFSRQGLVVYTTR